MKKLFKTLFFCALVFFIFANSGISKVFAQPGISSTITYQSFYDQLSPYGNWIEYPGYDHVWSPRVQGDFRPYLTNGSWEYTNDGWAWASNYNWGWAPFHYGRWLYDVQYGWLWIPGYDWSPAWVTWGEVDDYYAWAPLYPGVNVGFAYNNWRPDAIYWNLVPRSHIYDRDVYRFAENRQTSNVYIQRIQTLNNYNRTTVHNNYYAYGPDIKNVEKFTNRKITPVAIISSDKPMSSKREGNNLQLYRPSVEHPQPQVFKRIPQDNSTRNVENTRNISDEKVAQPNMNAGKVESRNNNQQNENLKINNSETPEKNYDNQNLELRKVQNADRVSEEQNADIQKMQSTERARENQNYENSRAQPVIAVPQNRSSEVLMPQIIDREVQRQNIDRMTEIKSPIRTIENRPSNSGMRRRN